MTQLVLKPHPANTTYVEIVDIYSADSEVPWCNAHVDLFWPSSPGDATLHDLLGQRKTITVELVVVSVQGGEDE